jgi:glycosyltransferase involved in cell wall biosynthesis
MEQPVAEVIAPPYRAPTNPSQQDGDDETRTRSAIGTENGDEKPTRGLGIPTAPTDGLVDVSILVPTRNESDNVVLLTERLGHAMAGVDFSWELLFVDDSDDSTPDPVAGLSARDPSVSLLHRRPTERTGGLAGAVVAGLDATRGRAVVVMDGDLQHPPDMARELSTPVLAGDCEVAIASRYVPGASADGLDSGKRRLMSRLCTALVHALVPRTRGVRDPMSGFFAVSRQTVEGARLRPHGFKILMEVLARGRHEQVYEVPFRMDRRAAGDSKAGAREGVRFLRHVVRLARPSRSSIASAARATALQVPLGGILAAQAWFTTKLVFRNTAFIDEATYISAGHYLLHWWAHGGTNMYFETYYSGSPAIYPVMAAMVDHVGGLSGVRFMSMAFMLIATALCYGTARQLFGRPAGWFAAGAFATTQGTYFLGALATFDAMSLMLIALAAWIVVRSAVSATTKSWIFLAVPVLALANASKYASGLFDPIVLALAFFVIMGHHGVREAVRKTVPLIAGLVLVIAALLAFAPHTYIKGIMWTTIDRFPSNNSSHAVLLDSWEWVGVIACAGALAVVAAVLAAWRRRVGWATVGVLVVLAGAVMLVPANQARIHTLTSLNKHVTFGAWFAAVAVGWLLYDLVGRRASDVWRYALVGVALVPLGVIGLRQANHEYHSWPDSTRLTQVLGPMLKHQTKPVLVDDAEVERYYLGNELPVPKWQDTFYFAYTPPGSKKRLVQVPAYRSAVMHGYFSVIALDFGQQIRYDRVIAHAITQSHRYSWITDVTLHATYGRDTYVVYRLNGSTS